MAGKVAKIPMDHRILRWDNTEIDFSGDPAINLSDTVFEFLHDEGERPSSSSYSICDNNVHGEEDEGDENEEKENDNANFWENQYHLLHATLCRTTSAESKIRSMTKETLKEAKEAGNTCACQKPVDGGGCRNCLMKEVFRRLQNVGFNSAICKSKWKSLPDIPSGEHTFVDVVDNSNPKRGEVRIIIELNFRGEFEMARSNEEYDRLVNSLPEVFVGKLERLLSVIKIMCTAAKRCMKERKMHLGPWRKQNYMQAKWLRTCHRTTAVPPRFSAAGYTSRVPRPTASMLTVDLLDNLPSLHRTAVAVV